MTATTRATHAAMLRNEALAKYEARVRQVLNQRRMERMTADGLGPSADAAAALLRGISRITGFAITYADEFEAKDGAA